MTGSDGLPGFGASTVQPRFTGTFPRIPGRCVREKNVLRLEEPIRKMTSLPAQTFRLRKKGRSREGFDAVVVIFDPDLVDSFQVHFARYRLRGRMVPAKAATPTARD